MPAYAATVHKSQGSEYPAVVIPVLTQHYAMLKRNLLYTGVTRGKRLVVLVGQKKAVAIAVRNVSGRRRWSKLDEWLALPTEFSSRERHRGGIGPSAGSIGPSAGSVECPSRRTGWRDGAEATTIGSARDRDGRQFVLAGRVSRAIRFPGLAWRLCGVREGKT